MKRRKRRGTKNLKELNFSFIYIFVKRIIASHLSVKSCKEENGTISSHLSELTLFEVENIPVGLSEMTNAFMTCSWLMTLKIKHFHI